MTATQQQRPAGSDFVISRVFDAPRELVWKCFTDPEHMKSWWGPKGVTVVDLENGSAPRRHLPLRHEDAGRRGDVGQAWSIARSCRLPSSCSSTRSRTRRAASRAIRWRRPGRSKCIRCSPSRSSPAARPSSRVRWSPHNATAEEQQDLRRRPRQHDAGLERHLGAARSLSGESPRQGSGLRAHHSAWPPAAVTPTQQRSFR